MRMKNVRIAASILSANFACLADDVKQALDAGIDEIHFDVMDHHFVPNLSFGAIICEALRKSGISAPIDVHLMVTNPEKYIEPFAKAGANRISFHAETVTNAKKLCEYIHDANMAVGLAFNPDKPVKIEKNLWPILDMILIMSVFAGFGGQKFMSEVLSKIRESRHWIERENLSVDIEVDGGISSKTVPQVIQAGANVLVAGSAIYGASDVSKAVKEMRELAQNSLGKVDQ